MTEICSIVPMEIASKNDKHLHKAIEEESTIIPSSRIVENKTTVKLTQSKASDVATPTSKKMLTPKPAYAHRPPPLSPQQNDPLYGTPHFSIDATPINHLRVPKSDLPHWNDVNEAAPPPLDDDEMQSVPPSVTPSYAAAKSKCMQCRILFNSKSELLQHNHSVHRQENGHQNGMKLIKLIVGRKIHHCHICNRSSFKTKQHYDYHMRCHSGAKPFKCKLCPKAYRAKHTLKNHMRKHTGERPYQCKVCKKCFSQLDPMKVHVKKAHSPIGKCKERKMNL